MHVSVSVFVHVRACVCQRVSVNTACGCGGCGCKFSVVRVRMWRDNKGAPQHCTQQHHKFTVPLILTTTMTSQPSSKDSLRGCVRRDSMNACVYGWRFVCDVGKNYYDE
eukprot:m.266337 g.266337  ORF g.266337 m.266337 type:complete len:109 (+) comp15630_c0_seq5:748-1074(+)